MLIRAILAAAALLCASPALSHSWYSVACCTGDDCGPVAISAVKATNAGWFVVESGETIPYGDKREQQSQDSDFHRCVYGPMAAEGLRGKTRCLYVPGFGS